MGSLFDARSSFTSTKETRIGGVQVHIQKVYVHKIPLVGKRSVMYNKVVQNMSWGWGMWVHPWCIWIEHAFGNVEHDPSIGRSLGK